MKFKIFDKDSKMQNELLEYCCKRKLIFYAIMCQHTYFLEPARIGTPRHALVRPGTYRAGKFPISPCATALKSMCATTLPA